MPLYILKCPECGRNEEMLLSISEMEKIVCPECNVNMKNQIEFQGGLQTEHPTWLDDSVRDSLQGDNEKPIENRTEYNKYLKDNNIVPLA